jgi:hypothetical protein
LDHRTPIARGGKHVLANLLPACERCNSIKGLWLESEFRALLAFLETVHPAARQDLECRLLAGGTVYAGQRSRR